MPAARRRSPTARATLEVTAIACPQDLGGSAPGPGRSDLMKILGLAFPVLLAIAACAPQAAAPSASPTTTPTTAPTVAATVAPTPTSPIPTVPAAVAVEVPVKGAALLVLDITNAVCTPRGSCVASLPKIAALIKKAREAKVPVLYSQTTAAGSTILPEVVPQVGEPSVATRADKFFNTTLHQLMKDRAVTTAVIVPFAAHGALRSNSFCS